MEFLVDACFRGSICLGQRRDALLEGRKSRSNRVDSTRRRSVAQVAGSVDKSEVIPSRSNRFSRSPTAACHLVDLRRPLDGSR